MSHSCDTQSRSFGDSFWEAPVNPLIEIPAGDPVGPPGLGPPRTGPRPAQQEPPPHLYDQHRWLSNHLLSGAPAWMSSPAGAGRPSRLTGCCNDTMTDRWSPHRSKQWLHRTIHCGTTGASPEWGLKEFPKTPFLSKGLFYNLFVKNGFQGLNPKIK